MALGLEREDQLVSAALSAFVRTYAGAKVVVHDLALGDGRSWSWLAQLADGGLCAALVVDEAHATEAWDVIDGLASLGEYEVEVRALLGLGPADAQRPPRAVLIAQRVSRACLTRAELLELRRVEAFELVRIRSAERSEAVLRAPRDAERRRRPDPLLAMPAGASAEDARGETMFRALQERLSRLDPRLEVEREGDLTVFRVYGHELARVHGEQQPPVAQIGADPAALTLDRPAALETFLARVVDRYLELGCWAGAEGGPATLALVEPLLSHEELAAFRELA